MLAYLFVIFAVLFRFLPHQYGFAPVVACLLFFVFGSPQAYVDSGGAAGAFRCALEQVCVRVSAGSGPVCDLGLVRSDRSSGYDSSEEVEHVANPGYGAGEFGVVLSDQQLRRVGGLQHVPQNTAGLDGFLRSRTAVLSARS